MTLDDLRGLPPTITVEEAGRILGISKPTAYQAAKAGQIPTIKLGSRLRVPVPKLMSALGISPADFHIEEPDRRVIPISEGRGTSA